MLPQDAFISSIRQINGTPEELLSNPEMLEIIVPMLRADFSLADQYLCTDRTPLNCPICVYGGAVDAEAPLEDLESWREYTTAGFSLKSFQGDHFFIHTAHTNLLNAISADLFRIVKKQPLQ